MKSLSWNAINLGMTHTIEKKMWVKSRNFVHRNITKLEKDFTIACRSSNVQQRICDGNHYRRNHPHTWRKFLTAGRGLEERMGITKVVVYTLARGTL